MMTIMMMMIMMMMMMIMIIIVVVVVYDQQMILSKILKMCQDEPNSISVKGSNFQETAVVETKSIFGVVHRIHRSQLFICL